MKNYCDACGNKRCSNLTVVPSNELADDWTECCYCRDEPAGNACPNCLERFPKNIDSESLTKDELICETCSSEDFTYLGDRKLLCKKCGATYNLETDSQEKTD